MVELIPLSLVYELAIDTNSTAFSKLVKLKFLSSLDSVCMLKKYYNIPSVKFLSKGI